MIVSGSGKSESPVGRERSWDPGDARNERTSEIDFRGAGGAINIVLAPHALEINLKVQLAHARDDRLGGLNIESDSKCRILENNRYFVQRVIWHWSYTVSPK